MSYRPERGSSSRRDHSRDVERRDDRDRSYDRDDNHRRDDRNRDYRNRDSGRRERSRDRDRDRYDRDRDRYDKSKDRSSDRYEKSRDSHTDRYAVREANHIVVLKNVNFETIQDTLLKYTSGYGEVPHFKLVVEGTKAIALAQFSKVEDSIRFQRAKHVVDNFPLSVEFSLPLPNDPVKNGWTCAHCGYNNYRKRGSCNNCSMEKPYVSKAVAKGHASQVLLVRGLNTSTDKDALVDSFSQYGRQLQDLRLIREKDTGFSRGFCFVEYFTAEDAAYVMQCAKNQLKIDGAKVRISFADSRPPKEHAEFDNSVLNNNAWGNYQASLQQKQASQSYPANPPPGSDFQYDSTTGYYYDTITGYYYDSNSQMFFDRQTQNYYHYNFQSGDYVKVGAETPSEPAVTKTIDKTKMKKVSMTKKSVLKKKGISMGISIQVGAVTEITPVINTPAPLKSKRIAKDINRWSRKTQELNEELGVKAAGDKMVQKIEPLFEEELILPEDIPITHENNCLLCRKKFRYLPSLEEHLLSSLLHAGNLKTLDNQRNQTEKRKRDEDLDENDRPQKIRKIEH